jgi:long-chain acyl-CoA synthetase
MLTLPSLLQRTARLYGGQTAIRDAEGDLTWAAYLDRVARAAAMLSKLGVRPGQRFGILCRNCVRHAELIYAGYWSGAVPVPVNYRLAPPEIAAVLEDAECRILAVESVFADLLERPPLTDWRGRAIRIATDGRTDASPDYDALRDAMAPVAAHEPAEEGEAILLYTGGTTGRGKGVPLSHRNIVSNALQLSHVMSVCGTDSYLHASPMFHSTDLKATALTMVGGAHAYLADFSPVNVIEAISRHGISIASLVPTMLRRILDAPELHQGGGAGTLRLISYGTSPMPVELIHRVTQAFPGVDLHQCYGLTETSPILAVLDQADHRRGLSGRAELLRSSGRPLPGVDIRIVANDGRTLPIGDTGEIVVRGPQVAKGYHNRPRETEEAFRDGWFWTADIGRIDAEGYLYVLDRKKEMVITGGENVYTSEVEAVLCQHPAVSEVAVIGVPDERFGEALLAAIVLLPGRQVSADEIIAHCRGQIGGYKIPRRIAFVEALPRSAVGKVLKRDLRRAYGGQISEQGGMG